jgi:hypothetical protein
MNADDIDRVVEVSTRKLFQIACPPVRYFILSDLMGKGERDMLVRRTIGECANYPPRVKLLASLRPDGTWPIPRQRKMSEDSGKGPPYGWTYVTMLRNLNTLSDYITDREEGNVEAALERILGWQRDDGSIPGPWDVPFALPHYNGFALRALLAFGMEKDRRVQKLVKWVLGTQRSDGGWIIPYLEDMRYLPEFKALSQDRFLDLVRTMKVPEHSPERFRDVPSCQWTTMMVVRGLCASRYIAQRPEVRRGAEFFLDRFFKKNQHALFYYSEKNWTRLKHPTYFGSGLCALDLLTWLGFGAKDPRMERPIAWLLSERSADFSWSQSERPNPERDQWITEIALSILNRYSESLRGLSFGLQAQLEGRKAKWPRLGS